MLDLASFRVTLQSARTLAAMIYSKIETGCKLKVKGATIASEIMLYIIMLYIDLFSIYVMSPLHPCAGNVKWGGRKRDIS